MPLPAKVSITSLTGIFGLARNSCRISSDLFTPLFFFAIRRLLGVKGFCVGYTNDVVKGFI
jgi:hypothetical protein